LREPGVAAAADLELGCHAHALVGERRVTRGPPRRRSGEHPLRTRRGPRWR
jgi:hypothetical protein